MDKNLNLRFVGTGEPMKPDLGNMIGLNRGPSSKAISLSGADSIKIFNNIMKTKKNPSPQDLGRNSAEISRKINSGTKVDLIA